MDSNKTPTTQHITGIVSPKFSLFYGDVERNRISSVQSHGKALEKECCLSDVFCDSGDTPANLLCELNGHLMPRSSCFYGKWVDDVCAGQFGAFVYLVLCCLVGCCTWFSCCAANVGLFTELFRTGTIDAVKPCPSHLRTGMLSSVLLIQSKTSFYRVYVPFLSKIVFVNIADESHI